MNSRYIARPRVAGEVVLVDFFTEFERIDLAYGSTESAKRALVLEIPSGKPPRREETADLMVRAARRGVDRYYRLQVAQDWYRYRLRLEKFLKRLGPPIFNSPPVLGESVPSDDWQCAERAIESAKAFHDGLWSYVRARERLNKMFGPQADHVFLENPRDGARVSMVCEIFRDAVDNKYEDPQAVELALIAVVLGLDRPMKESDEGGSDNRRARWQQTLIKARKLMADELSENPRGTRRR